MELSVLLQFLLVAVLLTISPGPDILFVAAQSISNGKKAGIATSLGLCSGLLVHTALVVLGISALIIKTPVVFSIIKYAGALYLLYLAYKAVREGNVAGQNKTLSKTSFFSLYRRGILMNILNPKVGIFFLALLPQFVNTDKGNTTVQLVVLAVIFLFETLIIFNSVALLAGLFGDKLLKNPKLMRIINYAKAGIFILIAMKIAL